MCRQSGLSHTINDLQSLPLPRYDAALARSLLTQVFAEKGLKVSGGVLDTIIDLVGPEVPFFLQLMAAAIIREHGQGAPHPPGAPPRAASRGGRVTPAAVRNLYEQVLLGSENRPFLDDYRSRLARSYLPAEENVAIVVLSALSKDRAGLDIASLRNEVIALHGDDALLERVLVLLEGDFYVVRELGGRYRFFNRYLADWWRRFHA